MQEKASNIIAKAVLILIGVYGIAILIAVNISSIYFELLLILYIFPSYIVLLFLTIIKIIDIKNLEHEKEQKMLHQNRVSTYKPIFDKRVTYNVAIIAAFVPLFNNVLCLYIVYQLIKEAIVFVKTKLKIKQR